MGNDVRYAWRTLRQSPGFAVVAILTLALGIGATTSTFSVVNAVVLKRLPYHDPGRLVELWETNPVKGWTEAPIAPANLFDWQKQNHVFSDMAAYPGAGSEQHTATISNFFLSGASGAVRLRGLVVTGNFFSVLGVNAALGRTLLPEETVDGRHHVVVLSHALWRRQFGGDPKIVGSTITLSGVKRTVVGIMPPDFYFPSRDAELWIPWGWKAAEMATYRRPHFLGVIARLKPGVTVDQARAEMHTIASRLERQYPDTNTRMGVGLGPLHDWIVSETRPALMLFLAAVGLVLLIACVNVANLLLARGSARAKEFAVRAALGAGRARLMRQLLTESLLVALAGGALGILMAMWSKDALVLLKPGMIPRLDEVGLDGRVLLFAMAISIFTSVLFGITPALAASRPDLAAAIERSGSRHSAGMEGALTRNFLVVSEIALALILVTGAGLLLRSFLRLATVDPGFNANRVLTMRISLPDATYPKGSQAIAFFDRLLGRIRTIPGVRAAAAAGTLGLQGNQWTSDFTVENRPPGEYGVEVRHNSTTPGYFQAMGIPLVSGRDFSEADGPKSPGVVIINETLARRYVPGENPIGRRLKFSRPEQKDDWLTIVGVVKDEKQDRLVVPAQAEIFQPYTQQTMSDMMVAVRSAIDPLRLVATVRGEIGSIDKDIAPYNFQTMETVVYESVAGERFALLLAVVLAAFAAILAAVGIYGVMSYTVARRTAEIGIRVAMGAGPRNIFRLVIGRAAKLAAVGVAAGIAGSFAATRLLAGMLFGVTASDPATYLAVALAVAAIVLVASYIPARRATRVDPVVALRYE